MIQRPFYRGEIPSAIVNDRDHQINSFVLGSKRAMRRIATAGRAQRTGKCLEQ